MDPFSLLNTGGSIMEDLFFKDCANFHKEKVVTLKKISEKIDQ